MPRKTHNQYAEGTKFTNKSGVKKTQAKRKSLDASQIGPGKRITVTGDTNNLPFYSKGGPLSGQNYVRIPVTALIPAEQLRNVSPGDKYRKNKVYIKGVQLRLTLRFATPTEVFAVLFDARAQSRAFTINRIDSGIPTTFGFGYPNTLGGSTAPTLQTLEECGMETQGGPFAVRGNGAGGYELDSIDGTLFTCTQNTHDWKPVGMAKWKDHVNKEEKIRRMYKEDFHVRSLVRTFESGNLGGYTHYDERCPVMYFKVEKEYEFKDDGTPESLVFDNPLEILLGVRSTSTFTSIATCLTTSFETGVVARVMVDVYFH